MPNWTFPEHLQSRAERNYWKGVVVHKRNGIGQRKKKVKTRARKRIKTDNKGDPSVHSF